ncbi:MAG: cyclase [Candidatus Marinimicrobia bacterium]|nr:cyclase [Chloroflexota bacterium]MBT4947237.1 cyclase [Candidatus Neomarinimicrobiota bacterium]MBT6356484.1 cyclase [Chloroflexota bacterium]
MNYTLLSYPIDEKTPTYGNLNEVKILAGKSIINGDSVNESSIRLPLHAGTHIDFPKHFYLNGQTLEDFPNSFWVCNSPVLINIETRNLLLMEEVVKQLAMISEGVEPDILLIKVNNDVPRNSSKYWEYNYGLHPDLARHIKKVFPSIRIVGMNSISLTSFQHRNEGREAHLEFLNPDSPILIIEDMNLSEVHNASNFNKIIVSPLQINNVDGVPVSILAEMSE